MLSRLLIVTALLASIAAPASVHAVEISAAGLWHSSGKFPNFEVPEPKQGLWKSSERQPVGNFRKSTTVFAETRQHSESATALKPTPKRAATAGVSLRFPYLSTLWLGI